MGEHRAKDPPVSWRIGEQLVKEMEEENSFARYLTSKKSIDDRALNQHVWQTLRENLKPHSAHSRLNVLEIGVGIGTMVERMLERELFKAREIKSISYRGIDHQEENITRAHQRLMAWAENHGWQAQESDTKLALTKADIFMQLELQAIDLFELLDQQENKGEVDLLVAHAFLDLIDIPATMSRLMKLLRHGGMFYFTINYDGISIFEPSIDVEMESQILALYHRSMDERIVGGKPSGDSQSGRHMFQYIKQAGAKILASGASDWVVCPMDTRYPNDEAFFLQFILRTIEQQLRGHPELDARRFAWWMDERYKQIERSELVYIAHQMDFCGRVH